MEEERRSAEAQVVRGTDEKGDCMEVRREIESTAHGDTGTINGG